VIETAPETKLRAIRRLGASLVPAPYDECWTALESHRSDRMTGFFQHPSTTTRSSAATAR